MGSIFTTVSRINGRALVDLLAATSLDLSLA